MNNVKKMMLKEFISQNISWNYYLYQIMKKAQVNNFLNLIKRLNNIKAKKSIQLSQYQKIKPEINHNIQGDSQAYHIKNQTQIEGQQQYNNTKYKYKKMKSQITQITLHLCNETKRKNFYDFYRQSLQRKKAFKSLENIKIIKSSSKSLKFCQKQKQFLIQYNKKHEPSLSLSYYQSPSKDIKQNYDKYNEYKTMSEKDSANKGLQISTELKDNIGISHHLCNTLQPLKKMQNKKKIRLNRIRMINYKKLNSKTQENIIKQVDFGDEKIQGWNSQNYFENI